jgi:hypothetical protein
METLFVYSEPKSKSVPELICKEDENTMDIEKEQSQKQSTNEMIQSSLMNVLTSSDYSTRILFGSNVTLIKQSHRKTTSMLFQCSLLVLS